MGYSYLSVGVSTLRNRIQRLRTKIERNRVLLSMEEPNSIERFNVGKRGLAWSKLKRAYEVQI